MTRKEFIKVCGILGVSLPFQTVIASCNNDNTVTPSGFSDSVLIIGAGVAGMSTGYLLAQNGIDFKIIEASATYGGRVKHNTTFADFPIPLGAEWLHVDRSDLDAIVNDTSIQIVTQTQGYNGSDVIGYYDGTYSLSPLAKEFGNFEDQKFINSSWLDFFETYIVPSIQSNFIFNTPITSINYEGDKVVVNNNNGASYEADKVVVTVPLKILQMDTITFTPALSDSKQKAIQDATVWGGIKVFIEFTEKFYPVYLTFPDTETNEGQRLYYDASYAQNSSRNIIGLFAVGEQAKQYQSLSEEVLRDFILNELDTIFEGKASSNYINHIVQNWDDEPYISAAYLADNTSSRISRILSASVQDKIYFAGDAYTQENDWGAVHNAARSARDVVEEIV
ncbi:NAD(P)/FAD-dependent oxidoreductase [Flammeovirga sp. EKP202]|uniref:flavin monoamine oxidase family protein n=1 Tax=Flammeovirga sp. EKP202 TaxID=2770592 RepID=UPI00165F8E3A|nr:NAD(P)/FAD-dependent oxidoreductase [Flammeovirga sp. EKP202]MBD0403716.1 FAD-dependent oxidoreductase [Flammeovirga sp. EKP202]